MRDAFWLSDEERQTRELAQALARERIAPLAAQVDETESYPAEQRRPLRAQRDEDVGHQWLARVGDHAVCHCRSRAWPQGRDGVSRGADVSRLRARQARAQARRAWLADGSHSSDRLRSAHRTSPR